MYSLPDTALFNRLLEGELSPQDIDALIAWLGSEHPDPVLAALVLARLEQPVAEEDLTPEIQASMETRLPLILVNRNEKSKLYFLKTAWFRYGVAAAIIILLGTGLFKWLQPGAAPQPPVVKNKPEQKVILPGKAGAILTLDNGNSVVLDSLGNGLVATQNGAKVVLRNGQLVYNTGGVATAGISYNTMTTPKGRQFQLILPDGTKVWLNAASSVRYPTSFTGNERKVEISGEAYFEVVKNAQMPFRVKINGGTEIEVLGTHFNINAYADEASINTTLLEGSVQVFNGSEKIVLKPGQQAQTEGHFGQLQTPASHIKVLDNVNTDQVVAWKNGVFNFQDATLFEVMRQLERWYDIEIVYEKGIPGLEFMGTMGRDLSLSEVLNGLKMSEVHFRIEGRKVVVTP